MAKSHRRRRVGPNLYQRGDGVFLAGLTIAGKWSMKRLSARTKTEANEQVSKLKVEAASGPLPFRVDGLGRGFL